MDLGERYLVSYPKTNDVPTSIYQLRSRRVVVGFYPLASWELERCFACFAVQLFLVIQNERAEQGIIGTLKAALDAVVCITVRESTSARNGGS